MVDDFRRQLELYDPAERSDRVAVIGAGATGSWVTLLLDKLGVSVVKVIDGDIVEPHNLPNQAYGASNIGKLKAASIAGIASLIGSAKTVIDYSGVMLTNENYYNTLYGYSVVFCLVDSMSARKELFDIAVEKYKEDSANYPRYWIETRMGLTGYRIYLIDIDNDYQIEEYKKTLYSDEEAEVSACGASSSVVTTAVQCASHAVGMWLALINEAEYVPNEIIFDVHSSFIMSKKFEPKE